MTELIPLTHEHLSAYLDEHGEDFYGPEGHEITATLTLQPELVSVHRHPESGRPREIHFMVGAGTQDDPRQKIAELGPRTRREGEDVGPGYVDLLAEWMGRPIGHLQWKLRILHDNNLEPDSSLDRVVELAFDTDEMVTKFVASLADKTGAGELLRAVADLTQAVIAVHSVHADYETSYRASRVRAR